ncbi:MAG: (Fe-S)-binding protein [Cyanobacteriota bacterium]
MNQTELAKYKDKIDHCTRCGLCQAVCPVFDAAKSEIAVARGKLALMHGVLSGRLEFSPLVSKYIELCAGCSACQEFCPSGVSTDEIFLAAKEFIADKYGLSLPKKAIVKAFSSDKTLNFFSILLNLYSSSRAGFLAEMTPDSVPFISKLKLLNSQLNGKVKLKIDKINIKNSKPIFKIIYFPGCINKYVNPSVANAVVELLKSSNCDLITFDKLLCCGMPAKNAGALNVSRQLAKHNIELFTSENFSNFDFILVDCASCGSMLKSYVDLFSDNTEIKDKSLLIRDKIIDINELLLKLDIEYPVSKKDITVTYHDPCHLRRSQNIYKEPRALLLNIKGINFVEMQNSDTCCGAAGSFCITHSDISTKISTKKADNIILTGAEIVLTSCPSCKIGLTQGLLARNKKLNIYHPVELLHKLNFKNT